MTAELLTAIAGILLSLAFSYLPGLSDGFAKLDPTRKRLIMAGLLVLVSVGTFGLSCAGVINDAACTQAGAWALVSTFITALVANQATYSISPRKAE